MAEKKGNTSEVGEHGDSSFGTDYAGKERLSTKTKMKTAVKKRNEGGGMRTWDEKKPKSQVHRRQE